MSIQQNFKRYELKFLMTKQQQEKILDCMRFYMKPDEYGRVTIRNIYYDTDSFRLIRRSLEKPVYKEKLRVRSYRQTGLDEKVFVEIKKKYKSIVYKRRIMMEQRQAFAALSRQITFPDKSQIGCEIAAFVDHYETLMPAVFLSYEREAYYHLWDPDFRVTFDENILYRRSALSLNGGVYGFPITDGDTVLMEVKTKDAMPLWMTEELSKNKIYKTSFSKYGAAYTDICIRRREEQVCAPSSISVEEDVFFGDPGRIYVPGYAPHHL